MALDCSPDLFAHRFYVLVLFFSVSVIHKCGRLSWQLVTFDCLFVQFDFMIKYAY